MIEQRDLQLHTVRRLIGGAEARQRVVEALYQALDDGLSFGPRDLPQGDDREWLSGAVAVPLQHAADLALDALALDLAASLEDAPGRLIERIAESRRWQELGWD